MIILYLILSLVILLLIVILIRTFNFKPQIIKTTNYKQESVDQEKVTIHFQEMIRLKTISNSDEKKVDYNEFDKFKQLLINNYPLINQKCELKYFGKTGIMYHLKGKEHTSPSVLMAHYDVVEVSEDKWDVPPFEAQIIDNILYGRGSIDTKVTLLGIMEGLEKVLQTNFVPQNDLYLCFSGQEEVNGNDALTMALYFKEQNIIPKLVLDEGGAIVNGFFPKVSENVAVVGIAEKGIVNIKLSINSNGGHSSTPNKETPLGIIAKAIYRLEKHPFPYKLTYAPKMLFNNVAPYSKSFLIRMIFANLWLFLPLLKLMCKKSGGEMAALLHTTTAPTMASASKMPNVLSTNAEVIINFRLLSGETRETLINRIKKIIKDDRISIEVIYGENPSNTSILDESYLKLATTIKDVFGKDTIVTPYLMLAGSDSRHYNKICNNVYRFSVLELSKEERALIHGNNERLPLSKAFKVVEFYTTFIKRL